LPEISVQRLPSQRGRLRGWQRKKRVDRQVIKRGSSLEIVCGLTWMFPQVIDIKIGGKRDR
jgi:hypothetical protein